jgi:hypothetical protein
MIEIIILFYVVLIWLALGVVGYGLEHAYFTREWPMITESRLPSAYWIVCGLCTFTAITIHLVKEFGWSKAFKHGFLI